MKLSVRRGNCALIILLQIYCLSNAQVFPDSGAKLNFTQVMFEHGKVAGAVKYVTQVALDTSGAGFNNPVIEHADSSTAALICGLRFGQKYRWRYCGVVGGKRTGWHGPFPFEIAGDDTNQVVQPYTTVVNDSTRNSGGLIAEDFGSIINRDGNPVWSLAQCKNKFGPIRDLRVTPYGTITFLWSGNGYECDLAGNILWRTPVNAKVEGDSIEFFHHDFQHLPNGDYMILGGMNVWLKVPEKYAADFEKIDSGIADPAFRITDGVMYTRIETGIIVEYNKDGKVVWAWNAKNYLTDDIIFSTLLYTMMNATVSGADQTANDREAHMNAFSMDDKNEYVYIGFRQLNRVIKIDKKTGKVVFGWGEKSDPALAPGRNNFFYHQHGTNLLPDGSIAVFNNSPESLPGKPSSIVVFSQPSDSGGSKIIWQFDCVFDSMVVKSGRGGNVDLLPNGNFLVCMGINQIRTMTPPENHGPAEAAASTGQPKEKEPFSRIFEVTKNKEVVWDAVIREKPRRAPYRAHYTSSLYPCYFTAQSDLDTLSGKAAPFNLKIFNVGTEPDSYCVSVSSASSTYQNQFSTATIPGGKSVRLQISSKRKPVKDDIIKITVQSSTNPDFIREVDVACKK